MKKLLALVLIFVLMLGVTACGGKKEAESPVTDALLAAPEIVKDYDVKADFKLGVILLHDENSTYDLNFINAVMAVKKALGLTDDQVIMKRNIPESNDCYEAAKEQNRMILYDNFAKAYGL